MTGEEDHGKGIHHDPMELLAQGEMAVDDLLPHCDVQEEYGVDPSAAEAWDEPPEEDPFGHGWDLG